VKGRSSGAPISPKIGFKWRLTRGAKGVFGPGGPEAVGLRLGGCTGRLVDLAIPGQLCTRSHRLSRTKGRKWAEPARRFNAGPAWR